MECNRDEAIRAKEIAEKKFTKNDIMGARRLAMKAKTMFPGLQGIESMLQTLDVYVSAEKSDWCGVLKVDPKADQETMRKRYFELLLKLNPATNRSIGADGALELVSKAWTLLSDNPPPQHSDSSDRQRNSEHKTAKNARRMTDESSNVSVKRRCIENDGGASSSGRERHEPMAPNVPDRCSFCDFDQVYRDKDSVGEGQVWAFYDEIDRMPRKYVRVNCVALSDPLTLGMIRFSSTSYGRVPQGCGELLPGRWKTLSCFNSFSHKIKLTERPDGTICVYPQKGDVWAVYNNWTPNWGELTMRDVIYGIVEVVEGYDGEGVSVTPLVKVARFKTVFGRQLEHVFRRIHAEEMFRFSHRIPSYYISGEEALNAAKGCWDLDPAAIPSQVLERYQQNTARRTSN